MLQAEDQSRNSKENIRIAWEEGDLWKLVCAGFDSFMNMICSGAPISFQKFLEYTSISFDKYIQDVAQKECLSFIGGKMVLSLEKPETEKCVPIQLSADFYFQTPDKKWVVKKKSGMVESNRFCDWDKDEDAYKLRNTGKMELSIEPPKRGG